MSFNPFSTAVKKMPKVLAKEVSQAAGSKDPPAVVISGLQAVRFRLYRYRITAAAIMTA